MQQPQKERKPGAAVAWATTAAGSLDTNKKATTESYKCNKTWAPPTHMGRREEKLSDQHHTPHHNMGKTAPMSLNQFLQSWWLGDTDLST